MQMSSIVCSVMPYTLTKYSNTDALLIFSLECIETVKFEVKRWRLLNKV